MKNKNLIIAIGLFIAGLIVGSYGGRLVSLPLVGMQSDASMPGPQFCSGSELGAALYKKCMTCIRSGGTWAHGPNVCTYAALYEEEGQVPEKK